MKHTLYAAFAAVILSAFLTGCGSQQQSPAASEESADSLEIGSALTIGIPPVTAHAGDKAVPVDVKIWNNPGYNGAGIQILYDAALTPLQGTEVNEFSDAPAGKCDLGEAAEGFLKSCLIGVEDHMIAFGTMGGEDCTADGTIFTVYFDIPEDAPSGHSFTLSCVLDSISNDSKTKLSPVMLDGSITIE